MLLFSWLILWCVSACWGAAIPEEETALVDNVQVQVDSSILWNPTGINIPCDETSYYSIVPEPSGQEWTDWYIACGPEGYEKWYLRPFEGLRRIPEANWLELVCCAGEDLDECVTVGDGVTQAQFTCSSSSSSAAVYKIISSLGIVATYVEMKCFANDMENMYWNNKGSITVRVTF